MSETYTIGGNALQPIGGSCYAAQSFIPLESHTLSFIDINLRTVHPTRAPSIWVHYADADHKPIGIPISESIRYYAKDWNLFNVFRMRAQMTPIRLVAGIEYVIVIHAFALDFDHYMNWEYDKDEATYPRGIRLISNDSGNTWTPKPDQDHIFCEFGEPPLPKPEPPPPVEHLAILAITQTPTRDGVKIILPTSVPCHLTCYWTDKQPRKHHLTRIVRGIAVPWYTYFCFVGWHAVEQIEPGDTLYHTFDLSPWPICETRWFTFRGEVDNILSPSVGPIFKKHHRRAIATLILRPNAPGDPTPFLAQYPHEGENWDKVCEVIPDEGATYVYEMSGFYWDLYNLPNHTTETGFITLVKVYCRCMKNKVDSGFTTPIIKTHGVEYKPSGQPLTLNYANYRYPWPNNPFTHLPWTWEEIDTLQAGVRLSSGLFVVARCTQVYVQVTYQTLIE